LIIFSLGFLTLFVVAGFEGYYNYSLTHHPTEKRPSPINFEIEKGQSVKDVARGLKEKGVISSEFMFLTYLKREKLDTKIQAGVYVIPRSLMIPELVEYLQDAKEEQKIITILEGWSIKDIKNYFEEIGFTKKSFENCLEHCVFKNDFITKDIKFNNYEGFLFPDTYKVNTKSHIDTVLRKLVDNFENKLKKIKKKQDNTLQQFAQEHSLYEIITVASLIEREVRTEEDRPIVSGIIWERLRQGEILGIDATYLYELGDWEADITYEVLEKESPYNLRKKQGLPPTPICQPSFKSIEAAFNPKDTGYFYYLTNDKGVVIYGKTLQEHNRNKVKYLN